MAIIAEDALALRQKVPVGIGIVMEFLKPLLLRSIALASVVPNDPPVTELQMPIHAAVGRIGDDDVHGSVGE